MMEKNDTLRECQDLIYKLSLCESSMPEDIETLLRFAHTQQARGLREAAEIAKQNVYMSDTASSGGQFGGPSSCEYNCGELIASVLQAQATAREHGKAPHL